MLKVELVNEPGPPRIDAAFSVEAGECLVITGPSGSGKTSILRMIAGLMIPSRGSVAVGNLTLLCTENSVDLPPEARRCGFVFQDYALFDHLSAWQNVAFGLGGAARGRKREAALDQLGRLGVGELADAKPTDLSGGEQQRVAIARALASRPEVLLLDEPFGALDVSARAKAADEISELVQRLDVPAVLVTHDFFEASLLGSNVAVLEDGAIAQLGSAAALAASPASEFVAGLTGSNLLSGSAQVRSDGLTEVTLAGGGMILSTDQVTGEVAVSIMPWEIALRELQGSSDSARNRLTGTVGSITPVGNRLRVTLELPQALVAELTAEAIAELGLTVGDQIEAVFKASATRLYAR